MKKIQNNLLLIVSVLETFLFIGLFGYLVKLHSTVTKLDWVSHETISRSILITTLLFVISTIAFSYSFITKKANKEKDNATNDSNNLLQTKENEENEQRKLQEQKNVERKNKLEDLLSKEKNSPSLHELFTRFVATELGEAAAFFISKKMDNKNVLCWDAGYAFYVPESKPLIYDFGEGITGQVAKDRKLVNLQNATVNVNPVISGLGNANPSNVMICPVLKNEEVYGVIEIASFSPFLKYDETFIMEAVAMLIFSMNNK